MSENEKNNQLIVTGKQELAKVSKTLAITNKLLTEIENREPSDDFRVVIPDEAFQEYLKDIGVSVENGTVAYGDVKNIEKIECSTVYKGKNNWERGYEQGWQIENLEGISYFIGLIEIHCEGHSISSLDVSKNVKLERLNCSFNFMSFLNVSGNKLLRFLECEENELPELNLSKNINLVSLRCRNNKLLELNLSKNKKLGAVYCNSNNLRTLNLTFNNKLTVLFCQDNKLSSIDISKNLELIYISYDDKLFDIDKSNNPNLMSKTV